MSDMKRPLTRQKIAAQNRSAPGKVTGRLKKAIEQMVWEGARRKDAAEAAGLRDHSLRQALRRPHVLAFYRNELDVLKTSARARNFHRLDAIADTSRNDMARVAAVKTLEALTDEAPRFGQPTVAGLQIVVIQGPTHAPQIEQQRTVELNPLPARPSIAADKGERAE